MARPITVTADNASRAYGDANPALTYAVGASGLVNGDALAGTLATSANAVSNVGMYAITQGTLSSSFNYAVSYVPGTLVVDYAPPRQGAETGPSVWRGAIGTANACGATTTDGLAFVQARIGCAGGGGN